MSKESVVSALNAVREQSPLVHNVTNFVVMNTTANALLAIGASPIMAHAPEEVADLAALCGSLVLNIGTLSSPWIDSMEIAAKAAAENGTPIIVDPVGSGATSFRTEAVKRLFAAAKPAVVRGNASEIMSLLDENAKTKGVDSSESSDAALAPAKALAAELGCVVCVSGETDYITDGTRVLTTASGHEMMTKVTGMGCTATALIGAFAAAVDDPLDAALSAMAVMGIAGEAAAEKCAGPGSLQMHFLDALHAIGPGEIEARFRESL